MNSFWLALFTSIYFCSCKSALQAIPAAVVQTYALLLSENPSSLVLLSILVSILSISLGVTNMAFDFDLNPAFRIENPAFYGYLPAESSKRFAIFVALCLFSSCQIAMRIIGISVLAATNAFYVVLFLGGDMGLYIFVKVVREDLRWFPRIDGLTSWILSIFLRIFNKIFVL